MTTRTMFSYPRQDLVAGLVVFLVAVPLCLGIAVACGVPPVSGLIAGVAGGIVAPWISRSPLSVTGPAAGLISVVLAEVQRLGSIEAFMAALVLSGVMQFSLGVFRLGKFSALVPASVIKGMLASIGITILLKQFPVALGVQGGLGQIATEFNSGAALIAALSLAILYGWKYTPLARVPFIPAALMVVVVAALVAPFTGGVPLVEVPTGGWAVLSGALPRPDWASLLGSSAWVTALTLALVASVESLLSCQAVDRLDPLKRHSPPDRELMAQGAANAASGLLGGLPVTAVIVRSGANLAAGGRERLSALTHGVLILVSTLFFAATLNRIPLAALAAVLIQVGLKLASPVLFVEQRRLGPSQFVPFLVTIGAVLATDLLKGVIIGLVVGLFFILHQNAQGAVETVRAADGRLRIKFRRDATFLIKPALLAAFEAVEEGSKLVVDGSGVFVDQDVREAILAFIEDAHSRGIQVSLEGLSLP
jgi:MFS superfamily sulfate permease-like transporter